MNSKNVGFSPHFLSSTTVGIGASAGGLEAINNLFDNMPSRTGFSFVIVQHISPDHKSLMAELVSKHSDMPVLEAEDNMPVKPDHIYVIPSKKFIRIEGGKLRLVEKVKNHLPNNAIDVFFESLAYESKEKAIGIILSGTGTDGTKGAKVIKQQGGIVIVQDPATAAFDGMPNSAITANLGDLIVPPEMIAHDLVELLNEPPQVKAFQSEAEKDESLLQDLMQKILQKTGLDFIHYKRPTIVRRLAKRLTEIGISSLKTYLDYIALHPDELATISREFLINVSSFFRDHEPFEILRNKVIPAIFKEKKPGEGIKAWSVACSTGEEAYSLAILFKEYLDKTNQPSINVKIFATDIDRDALETASRGVYPKTILQDVPGERIARYFVPEGNSYRIHPDIRKMVVFSYHNILNDPPFGRMDLVSCRNMLIYINAEQQKEIQRRLHFALNLGGYLFLGSSENISLLKNVLEVTDRKWKIFKCISKNRAEVYPSYFTPLEKRLSARPAQRQKNPLNHVEELFNETLLESQRVAGFFITKDLEVKQATGNYKKFIDFPESGFHFNLLKMVRPEISIALSVAINQAIRENKVVIKKDIRVVHEQKKQSVDIIVKTFLQTREYQHPFLFIVLEEKDEPRQLEHTHGTTDFKGELQLSEMEHELLETRTNLQLLLEEVETSNEELRSINEEATSTNEELQSTNEELQSLNEELHTVSAEHQVKIKELLELNDDLNNYFNNSEIGQILIDRQLIIRRFTPSVSRMINLIDTDINRSIMDITTRIRNVDLVEEIRKVIRLSTPVEKEIELKDNTIILMRITPYLRLDRSTDGVVINFIDISEVKRLNSLLQAIFENSPYCIAAKKAIRNEKNEIIDFEYVAANKACEKLYGWKHGSIDGKRFSMAPHFNNDTLALYKKVVETGDPQRLEVYDPSLGKWLDIHVNKMMDGVVKTVTDISERIKTAKTIEESYERLKTASEKLERSNMDLMQFASIASHDLKEPLRKIETFGNLLNEKLKLKLDDNEFKYLEKIIRSSNRMQSLVEDVLTFSKLSNSEQNHTSVDLNKILQRILDDLEITIQEKKAKINLGKLPVVRAVRGQMHQLFQNLISNALKFNDQETPVITIQEKKLSSSTLAELKIKPRDFICISVKDNGIGIEEKFRDKIFGIFQRLNGNQFEGTGIGLAICKKIVENNKGYLLLESNPGQGSEFMVVMPNHVNN